MDPASAGAGLVMLGGSLAEAVTRIARVVHDFNHAPTDIHRLQEQFRLSQNSVQCLKSSGISSKSKIGDALEVLVHSLDHLFHNIPEHPPSRRDRLSWALFVKKRLHSRLEAHHLLETAATLRVVGELVQAVNDLAYASKALNDNIECLKIEVNDTMSRTVQKQKCETVRKHRAKILQLKSMSCSRFTAFVATAGDRSHLRVELAFRHITSIITIQHSWRGWMPALPVIRLYWQAVHAVNSEIVVASHHGNVSMLQDLWNAGRFSGNDVTEDNVTLLSLAIESGVSESVQLLLQLGADPNLSFGEKHMTPLNSAFHHGRSDVARGLIRAGADIDNVNGRTWTSLTYLWDPERSNAHSVQELLQVCSANGYEGWDSQDNIGWAPIHQAAAFGTGNDLRLLSQYADIRIMTWYERWPIHIAVSFGNLDTFEYLFNLDNTRDHFFDPDRYGWTLLHLAAQEGHDGIISMLLKAGADPKKLTDPSPFGVPAQFENRRVSPRTIAAECGQLRPFDNAARAQGLDIATL